MKKVDASGMEGQNLCVGKKKRKIRRMVRRRETIGKSRKEESGRECQNRSNGKEVRELRCKG